jgi:hypothetical protein
LIELNEYGNESEQDNESGYQAAKTSHPKCTESDASIALVFGNHQPSNQKARDAKENINANPTALNDAAVKCHNHQDRESSQSIKAG